MRGPFLLLGLLAVGSLLVPAAAAQDTPHKDWLLLFEYDMTVHG